MTLKVGELYKARNGKAVRIVEAFGSGMFVGNTSGGYDAIRVIYKADGSASSPGWAEWSIDGLDPRVAELASKRLESYEEEAARRCPTDDRLDKLEAICSDLFRQLRNVRAKVGDNSGLIADLAAKVDEDIQRLDDTDRHVNELVARTYLPSGSLASIMQQLRADIADVDDRIKDCEKVWPHGTDNRLHQLATDITKVDDRVSLIEAAIEGDRDVGGRLQQLEYDVTAVGDRVSDLDQARAWIDTKSVYARVGAIEQTLARIEDMLTAEKGATDPGHTFTYSTPPAGFPDYSKGPRYPMPNGDGITIDKEELLRREAKAKRVIKGGWVNVYSFGFGQHKPYGTKAEADGQISNEERIACIQIPDITEGEGL